MVSALPDRVDVAVVGAGPAGLSAALNLGRARMATLVADAGRPRNAATLRSHGFLTRDGVSPLELRRLGLLELAEYPDVHVMRRSEVVSVSRRRDGSGFAVTVSTRRGRVEVEAGAVLVATGLRETLPEITGLRSFYGVSVFSCIVCDGWELRDRPIALIGHTPDLAERARLVSRWTDRLTVFTDGRSTITAEDEIQLAHLGVRVDRRPVASLDGDRGVLTAVTLADGASVAVEGGFVRPEWQPALHFLEGLPMDHDDSGCLIVDPDGRTSIAGISAAGDVTSPGPQQLIVAAGQAARAAVALVDALAGSQR